MSENDGLKCKEAFPGIDKNRDHLVSLDDLKNSGPELRDKQRDLAKELGFPDSVIALMFWFA